MRVYVLLFNVGTDNEGIHTLKLKENDPGGDSEAVRNVVLMFESEDDATRYSVLLEAQDFMAPAVESIDSEEVEEFCRDADYDCVVVPEGTLTLPPEANVEQTDWQPEGSPRSDESTTDEFSESELDRIRRRLEGLL